MLLSSSDAELVLRAKAGEEHALTQIYERYANAIYRYIFFRVREVELAEDIQAEVFLRMLEGLERYEDRGWPLSAWLYRIAHDRTIDTIRQRSKRHIVRLEHWEGSCDGPEHAVNTLLEHEELRRTLANLTADQQEVISLRFMADLSVQEVATKLGCSEGAVKALQHRGIKSLARHLQTSMA